MVAAETRWDTSIALKKHFRYSYTMVNYAAEDIDVEAFTSAMQIKIVNMVCTTPEMDVFTKIIYS